jgi:hypothetical protein
MSNFRHIVVAFLAVIVLIATGAASSMAQSYTLTIQEGQVFVNGKKIEEDQIPSSLDVRTMNVHLSFTGTPDPTFELGGHYYVIEAQGLKEVQQTKPSRDDTTVIFRNAPPQAAMSRPSGSVRVEVDAEMAANPKNQMQQYVFELSENARQLNEMSGSLSQRNAQALIEQMYFQAEQAARIAEELPYLEQQSYLDQVGQRDQALYQRLINELELERETQRLAAEARGLPAGEARERKLVELRDLLRKILDLKQENRRREIAQLESELTLLHQRLAEREALKDRMIEKRMQELLR